MAKADGEHGGTATQVVPIDNTGTIDAPIITSRAQPASVTHFPYTTLFRSKATGQVTFTDVDASDTHTLSVSVAAAHGSASVDADGTWHYTVSDSGAVNALAVGEHLADKIGRASCRESGELVTEVVSVDSTGTNDAPVITSASHHAEVGKRDGRVTRIQTCTLPITFTDVDASDTHTLSVSVAAAHGSASVDADGTWHYTVSDSGAVNALAVGEHLAD